MLSPPNEGQGALPLTSVRKIEADGVQVFYRAAGDPSAPVVLLLHGFPTSSFMFRELIPRLADHYRVIAPDMPGFGFTEVPVERKYTYSFDALAGTIEAFMEALTIKRYALYVFDYGAPTGFRLAIAHPERVAAIISQNGNAYEEGLGDAWGPIRKYWAMPTPENREIIRQNVLTLEGTRWQYTHGVAIPESIGPESYTLDSALMERPGNIRDSAGFIFGLCLQREALSEVSGISSQIEAPFACDLGQERSFFRPGRSGGISERRTEGAGPVPGYRTFCYRDTRFGNRRGDERISRNEPHIAPG